MATQATSLLKVPVKTDFSSPPTHRSWDSVEGKVEGEE